MAGIVSMRNARCLMLVVSTWLVSASLACALPLWEVQGTANRVFLLGSIHFLRETDYPLPRAFDDVYSHSDVVVMEVDPSHLDPVQVLKSIQRIAIDPRGLTLEELLGRRSYQKALDLAANVDIDLIAMSAFEPWYAAIQVTQLRLMQLGFDGDQGVESRLLQRALQDQKEIRGLETLEEQLGFLDGLPLKDQSHFLILTLEEAAEIDTDLDNMVAAWKTGDIDALETELVNGLGTQKALYQRIVVERNENWTRSIIDLTEEPQNCLVVVGAMHLVGNDSVIDMLQDAGFSAKRIKNGVEPH